LSGSLFLVRSVLGEFVVLERSLEVFVLDLFGFNFVRCRGLVWCPGSTRVWLFVGLGRGLLLRVPLANGLCCVFGRTCLFCSLGLIEGMMGSDSMFDPQWSGRVRSCLPTYLFDP
jgi:hypothetical protein